MLRLDDDIFSEDDGTVVNIKSNISKNQGLFTGAGISTPVVYNTIMKTFIPSGTVNEYSAFLGWIINKDNSKDLIDVLYRGFLFKEPLQFPATLKPLFIQSYIAGEFEKIKQAIKENMPRIKRLKRINLKMITKEHALMLYYYLDDFIARYQSMYDYVEAQKLKAQITTSPFYVNDNGIIKLYNFQTNELTIPDLESEGFFLAYFTFMNKTN